jgi:hypothetical protein
MVWEGNGTGRDTGGGGGPWERQRGNLLPYLLIDSHPIIDKHKSGSGYFHYPINPSMRINPLRVK